MSWSGMAGGTHHRPPGFRFCPTDVELLLYYLKRKVLGKGLPIDVICEVDLYKFGPEELPGKYRYPTSDREWYFFCRLDRKSLNSQKMNREACNGSWKTTGKDRVISHDSRDVGKRKTLVFHIGKAPQLSRTEWVIHEYRLDDPCWKHPTIRQDTFVLCKLLDKSGLGPKTSEHYGAHLEEEWEDDQVSPENLHQVFSSDVQSTMDNVEQPMHLGREIVHQVISSDAQSTMNNVEQPMHLGSYNTPHFQSSEPETCLYGDVYSQMNDGLQVQDILCRTLYDEESISIYQRCGSYGIDNEQETITDYNGPQISDSRVKSPFQFGRHNIISGNVECEKILMSLDGEPQTVDFNMESLEEARVDFTSPYNSSPHFFGLENAPDDTRNFPVGSSSCEQFGSSSFQLADFLYSNDCPESEHGQALYCPQSSAQGDLHGYQTTATTNGSGCLEPEQCQALRFPHSTR